MESGDHILYIIYDTWGSSCMKEMKNQAVICSYNEDVLSLSWESSKKTEFYIL